MFEVDLTDWDVQVRDGDVLAIALSSDHTFYSHSSWNYDQYLWRTASADPHPGGDFYIYSPLAWYPYPYKVQDLYPPPNTRDMGFRVLIEPVPEPTSILLLMMGLFWIAALLRTAS